MSLKIEVHSTVKLPNKTIPKLNNVLDRLPKEHLIGIERVRLVDSIDHPRLNATQRKTLPGLYHPKHGAQRAWLEISVDALLPKETGLIKRFLPRLAFYNNLTAVLVSLVGQHYYLSLRHSVKKDSLEPAVRSYTAKHLKSINEAEHKFRTRIFAPLQPRLERWARALNHKAQR